MEILHFENLGIRVSFCCESSCSSHRRVSNFNSKVPQGGIYPHIKFERDMLNIFRVRVFTSSGSTGGCGGRSRCGGDAKTIISPNTSFGDIIKKFLKIVHGVISWTSSKMRRKIQGMKIYFVGGGGGGGQLVHFMTDKDFL